MAKIAVKSEGPPTRQNGGIAPGRTDVRILAQGDGWSAADVVCTCGPHDRAFEEQHSGFCVAVVLAGSFQYRSRPGRELMTPGSLLLGEPGQYFECSHEHAAGDRCVSFRYTPEYIDAVVAPVIAPRRADFRVPKLPPLRSLSRTVAQVWAVAEKTPGGTLESLAIDLAVQAATLAGTGDLASGFSRIPPSAEARVTRVVRHIERYPEQEIALSELAREAGLSRYHFLRVFESITGVTPHQFILRTRLRNAAQRLIADPTRILDIALDCGFGDVSNFNRAFRKEFGVAPRAYRSGAREPESTLPLRYRRGSAGTNI